MQKKRPNFTNFMPLLKAGKCNVWSIVVKKYTL